jgi:hypothetical protein
VSAARTVHERGCTPVSVPSTVLFTRERGPH